MLTERENLLEVIHRGKPERFANQYDAFEIVSTPIMENRNQAMPGEINKINDWGCTVSWEEGQPGAFPVHKPGTIVMPDVEEWRETVKAPKADYAKIDWEPFIAQAEAIDRKERFVTAIEAPGVFELCHYLGEITNILMAFYESPEDLKDLIKYITEWKLTIAEGICKYLKPDALLHHDDWGTDVSTFVSPEMFEEFFLPSYKELYGYYHDHGVDLVVHHSDSYAATLVPYMIDMGVNIWQGVMRVNDIPALIEKCGDKISFMGGLDSTVVDVPNWTPELIRSEVEKTCEQNGPLSFIPCATQGMAISTFPGVYDTIHDEIDRYSKIYFAR